MAVKPQEFSFSWETCRHRVPCAQEHFYEETSCVPGKDVVISLALLVVTIKLSDRSIDLLFDLLEVNCQCTRPHSKETISMVVTVNLLCHAVLLLGMSFSSTMKIACLFL